MANYQKETEVITAAPITKVKKMPSYSNRVEFSPLGFPKERTKSQLAVYEEKVNTRKTVVPDNYEDSFEIISAVEIQTTRNVRTKQDNIIIKINCKSSN